jgi:hypothetical protein
MLSFFAAWSVLELVLFTLFMLLLGWGTSRDRNQRGSGDASFKWVILGVGFVGYLVYYAITEDDWFPPLFSTHFWMEQGTWITFGKYVGTGLLYALLELVMAIRHEQKQIKVKWLKFLDENTEVASYLTGAIHEDVKVQHLRNKVRNFANDWGRHTSFVMLRLHDLEKTPQPSLQMHQVRDHVFAWTVLWPGYAISLCFGRVLDSIIDALNSAYQKMGGVIVRLLFRNTFKSN